MQAYLYQTVTICAKLFDEWTDGYCTFPILVHGICVAIEQRKLATAGHGSNWPVPFPFSAISRRSFTVCNNMDSRLSFLTML